MMSDGIDFDQVEKIIEKEGKGSGKEERSEEERSLSGGSRQKEVVVEEDLEKSSSKRRRSRSASLSSSRKRERIRRDRSTSRDSDRDSRRKRKHRTDSRRRNRHYHSRRQERKDRRRSRSASPGRYRDRPNSKHEEGRKKKPDKSEDDTCGDKNTIRKFRRSTSRNAEGKDSSHSPPGLRAAFEESKKRFEDGARLANEEEDRRRKELEEARRDDMTVFVLNLPLKANEKDVWKFFSEQAGKVRDIQVIRDNQSGKSKGVGYVEFYSQESVLKALALSGHIILGNVIKVQASQAEKNRQAKAAKQQAAEAAESGPTKLFVGGLVESLSAITDDELRQLFTPFGEVLSTEINRDPYTQKSRGYGFIHFRKAQDAREAMSALNGFCIVDQPIKVGYAAEGQQAASAALGALSGSGFTGPSALVATAVQQLQKAAADVEGQESERLDDEGGGLLSGPTRRIALMQKLQRPEAQRQHGMRPHYASLEPMNAAPAITSNLCVGPLFSLEDVSQEGSSLFDEVAEDVKEECQKHGKLLSVYVNRVEPDGRAWVKFANPEDAHRAHVSLNGRLFGGNRVVVEFISDIDWEAFMRN